MKIGIDARFFGPIGKGLGRYTQKLIEELEKVDFENQYYIFINKSNKDDYTPHNPNFHKIVVDIPWYTLQEQIQMTQLLNRYHLDLVHFLHFNVPLLYRKPYIVTIHDLILLEYPTRKASRLGWVQYAIKTFAYKIVIRNAVQTAQSVIAISEYTKQSLLKHFGLADAKITTIYEGVDLERFHPLNQQNFDFHRYGITKDCYILYVGNVYPHKNIDRLVSVFSKLKKENILHSQDKLVLVGKQDYFFDKIYQLVQELELSEQVVFPGFVSDEQLIDLYKHSRLYVFPSLYEGFGLPPLEAIAIGASVIVSNATCLPEIFGGAVGYFDPTSEDDMARVISEYYHNSELRQSHHIYYEKVLSQYSWSKMAEETKMVYTNKEHK